MPDMLLNIAAAQVHITVDEPRRCELFRVQLEGVGAALTAYANAPLHLRVRPALVNAPGGDQNLSDLLSLLARILNIHVAPAIAREIGANDPGNPLRAFFWQNDSPVDGDAGDLHIEGANPVGLIAYCRFLELCLDRNFDPVALLPDEGAVAARAPDAFRDQGIAAFFGRHPDLAARAQRIADQFSQFVTRLCDRIAFDWEDIQRYFFGGQAVASLLKIDVTGSDTHKGTQQVAILTLSGDRRLVYKPSDMEWDALLAGDVQGLAAMAGQLQGHALGTVARWNDVAVANHFGDVPGLNVRRSLAQLLNSFLPDGNLFVAGKPKLPIYRILPCSAGSTLAIQPDRSRPIRDSYGYIEFLRSDPHLDRTFPNADHPSFKTYGYQIGQWLALLVLAGVGDMHQENLFICNRKPYPIDMEVVNFGFREELDPTLLVSTGILQQQELVMKFVLNIGPGAIDWSYRKIADPEHPNQLMRNQAFDAAEHPILPANQDIRRGFIDALAVIRQRASSFSAFMAGLLPGVVVRRLVPGLGTDYLIGFLNWVLGLSDAQIRQQCGERATLLLADWERKAVRWRQAYPRNDGLLKEPRQQIALKAEAETLNTERLLPDFPAYNAVADDFIAGDIPAFYQAYGETVLLDSLGNPVTADAAQVAPVGQTVLQLYPWAAGVVGGRVTRLIPRSQLEVQAEFLHDMALPPQSAYDAYLRGINDYLR